MPHDLILFSHIAVVAVKTAQLSQVSRIPALGPVSGQYLRGTARDLIILCLLIVPCNLIHFLPIAVVAVKKMAQLPQVSLIPAREPVSGQYLSRTISSPILLNLLTVSLDLMNAFTFTFQWSQSRRPNFHMSTRFLLESPYQVSILA